MTELTGQPTSDRGMKHKVGFSCASYQELDKCQLGEVYTSTAAKYCGRTLTYPIQILGRIEKPMTCVANFFLSFRSKVFDVLGANPFEKPNFFLLFFPLECHGVNHGINHRRVFIRFVMDQSDRFLDVACGKYVFYG
jgi:hypothetical protein